VKSAARLIDGEMSEVIGADEAAENERNLILRIEINSD